VVRLSRQGGHLALEARAASRVDAASAPGLGRDAASTARPRRRRDQEAGAGRQEARGERGEERQGRRGDRRSGTRAGPARPASDASLLAFLRRILFTISPGRLPKGSIEGAEGAASPQEDDAKSGRKGATAKQSSERDPGAKPRLRPLPARKAKLGLIEVMRDLAVEDTSFATLVAPLLEEFMGSRGPSERAACLVALTRIRRAHPSKDAA
jgi:hypothetical protein